MPARPLKVLLGRDGLAQHLHQPGAVLWRSSALRSCRRSILGSPCRAGRSCSGPWSRKGRPSSRKGRRRSRCLQHSPAAGNLGRGWARERGFCGCCSAGLVCQAERAGRGGYLLVSVLTALWQLLALVIVILTCTSKAIRTMSLHIA